MIHTLSFFISSLNPRVVACFLHATRTKPTWKKRKENRHPQILQQSLSDTTTAGGSILRLHITEEIVKAGTAGLRPTNAVCNITALLSSKVNHEKQRAPASFKLKFLLTCHIDTFAHPPWGAPGGTERTAQALGQEHRVQRPKLATDRLLVMCDLMCSKSKLHRRHRPWRDLLLEEEGRLVGAAPQTHGAVDAWALALPSRNAAGHFVWWVETWSLPFVAGCGEDVRVGERVPTKRLALFRDARIVRGIEQERCVPASGTFELIHSKGTCVKPTTYISSAAFPCTHLLPPHCCVLNASILCHGPCWKP